MTEETILFDVKNQVAWITLNRVEADNTLDSEMVQSIHTLVGRINQDPDIHVVVLTGAGQKAFCVGGEVPLADQGGEIFLAAGAARAVADIQCPVLAALNGDALAEGLELALACDVRFAVRTARFGLPQITFGRIPLDGGTQRLPRIVGRGKALEMVLSGELVDAPAALAIGLISRVIDPARLRGEVEGLAANLAGKAPLATRFVKEAVTKGLDLTLEQGLRLEGDLYFLLHTTEDRTEGIRSFQEKRPPHFKGK